MPTYSYHCKNGECVTIIIDDECELAQVLNSDKKEVGKLEFRLIQNEYGDYLKLIWAYLDKSGNSYLRQGIGRECLQRVAELSGLPILAENNDGQRNDDGSHLTGDAPGFVARMRQEGLIG